MCQEQRGISRGDWCGALGDQCPRRPGLLRACWIPPCGSTTVKRAVRTPSRRSSQNTEILRKLDSSKSQPLATIPRLVCGDVRWHARDRSHDQGEDLHLDEPGSGDCYSELPRNSLPRTSVNKGWARR